MSDDQSESSPKGQFRVEDGELVLSDPENVDEKSGDNNDKSNNRKSRRKQTFERRNIKKVREEVLSEEAKAAQKAEMERRQRLFSKEKCDQVKFSNIDFLLNDGHTSPDSLACQSQNIHSLDANDALTFKKEKYGTSPDACMLASDELDSTDHLTCFQEGEDKDAIKKSVIEFDASDTGPATASAALFGNKYNSGSPSKGYSQDDAILLGDSDDDQNVDSMVIEVSDGEEASEEPEVEAEICELQDAANLADADGKIVINTSREQDREQEICLSPQISRVIKPHQVSGVRFLYDNVVESLQRFHSTEGFGCILAHSMGLGKTIQIIGFLDILFRFCDAKRVLVIVPINTIQNWQAEFELWLPTDLLRWLSLRNKKSKKTNSSDTKQCTQKVSDDDCKEENLSKAEFPDCPANNCTKGLGTFDEELPDKIEKENSESSIQDYATDSKPSLGEHLAPDINLRPFNLFVVRDTVKTMSQRHQIIRQWFDEGGVLLLGYEMFRLLLSQKRTAPSWTDMRSTKRRKKEMYIDVEKEEKREKMWSDFRMALLDPGPELVICDEGHRIKNSEASISKALKAIKTHRRVVLTGYPLQNNLMEYWCMVDFVRPSYLGTKQEFTNMFQRPIENGQCIDSTPEDRKVMQGRAHVLHDLLSGFVQRRSHAVLKASLPPKTEIVLLIKLSPLQRTLYAAFMRSLSSNTPYGWAQVNTLKTYAMCCKIWNHPDILRRAMDEHKEAMDFDIDDTAQSNTHSTQRNVFRSNALSAFPTSNDSQSSLSVTVSSNNSNEHSMSNQNPNSDTSTTSVTTTTTSSTTTTADNVSLPFISPNPLMSIPQLSMYAQGLSSHSSFSYNPNIPHQASNVGTYDWANDSELWGADFKMGSVEHSGKVLLFLDLLKGSVLAGDKMLVFTQSLYTLDLLERILRRLPLPNMKESTEDIESTEETCQDVLGDCNALNENTPEGEEAEREEETLRTLHYRLSTRRGGCLEEPNVWTRNVHYFRLDGSTTASEREKLINNFNNPTNPSKLFLMSTRAGCLGVNLIGANRVVVFDASWNPCHDCQAVCRVYRYGQTKACYIYRLVSDNTMEKKIYDRQVTKQGMSDRVVDELNPTQQFTRSQVELLMSFEDKDLETITHEDVKICEGIAQSDPVLTPVLRRHKNWITKRPFTHESLLIDRKDYRLTRVEKRLAKQRYEQEKRLSLSYQQAHLFQLQQMQALQQQQHQQLLAAGINPALVDTSRLYTYRTPNILSRNNTGYRPTYTTGMAALDAMRQVDRQARLRMLQKDLDEARKRCGYTKSDEQTKTFDTADCKVTRIVANTDLYFPSTTNSTTTQRKIPKGELLEVIQTPKGKYLRITRTGDLFIVKTNSTSSPSAESNTAVSSVEGSDTMTGDTSKTPDNVVIKQSIRESLPTSSLPVDDSKNGHNRVSTECNRTSDGIGSASGDTTQSHTVSQSVNYVGDVSSSASGFSNCQKSSALDATISTSRYSNGHAFNNSQSFMQANNPAFPANSDMISNDNNNPIDSFHSKSTHALHHARPLDISNKTNHLANELFPSSDQTIKNGQNYESNCPTTYQNSPLSRHDSNKAVHENTNHAFSSPDIFRSHLQQQPSWLCSTCGRTPASGCACRPDTSIVTNPQVARNQTVVSTSSTATNVDTNISSRFSAFINRDTNQDSFPHSVSNKSTVSNIVNYSPAVASTAVPYYHTPSSTDATQRQLQLQQQQQHQQQQQQYLRAAEDIARQSMNSSTANPANNVYHAAYQHSLRPSVNTQNHSLFDQSSHSLQSQVSMMHDYFSQLTNQHQQISSLDTQRSRFVEQPNAMAAAMQQYLAHNSNSTNNNNNNANNPGMVNEQSQQERAQAHLRNQFNAAQYQQFQLAAAAKQQHLQHQHQQLQLQQRINNPDRVAPKLDMNQPSAHSSSSSSSMFNHLHSQRFPNFHFPQF